jgi:hypothetical protein
MDPIQTLTSIIHFLAGSFRRDGGRLRGDTGAVSIEQVLWYAAAAVSVAVVAAIIWNQIRTTASTPVQSPSAP